jgi:hypothetical protein
MTKLWYALQASEEDNDWGTGTYDREESIKIAKEKNYFRVAIIEQGNDPICIAELINGEDF